MIDRNDAKLPLCNALFWVRIGQTLYISRHLLRYETWQQMARSVYGRLHSRAIKAINDHASRFQSPKYARAAYETSSPCLKVMSDFRAKEQIAFSARARQKYGQNRHQFAKIYLATGSCRV